MSNKEKVQFFTDYLLDKGYIQQEDNSFINGFVTIRFMMGGTRVRGTDSNPEHAYYPIAIFLTPTNITEAGVIYNLLEIERKEVGSKAWKKIREQRKQE